MCGAGAAREEATGGRADGGERQRSPVGRSGHGEGGRQAGRRLGPGCGWLGGRQGRKGAAAAVRCGRCHGTGRAAAAAARVLTQVARQLQPREASGGEERKAAVSEAVLLCRRDEALEHGGGGTERDRSPRSPEAGRPPPTPGPPPGEKLGREGKVRALRRRRRPRLARPGRGEARPPRRKFSPASRLDSSGVGLCGEPQPRLVRLDRSCSLFPFSAPAGSWAAAPQATIGLFRFPGSCQHLCVAPEEPATPPQPLARRSAPARGRAAVSPGSPGGFGQNSGESTHFERVDSRAPYSL